MENSTHSFILSPDWKLINAISQIDRFDASWAVLEKREIKTLNHFKAIATVRSVGASTRMEGSEMTDEEVEALIENLGLLNLEDRNSQEVAGYFEALALISASYREIEVTADNIKNLHKLLFKYIENHKWQKGDYKKHGHIIESSRPDGTREVIFKTADPGPDTEEAMDKLIEWYRSDNETHPLVKSVLFAYDFICIHPFQDGNGWLGRLLINLLLLRNNYSWIQYISLEHEIENRKAAYYKELMQCQQERPGEDVHRIVMFFLDCIKNISRQLMTRLQAEGDMVQLAPREKSIYAFIENHPGCRSGKISHKLAIPLPTVKRILSELVNKKIIVKHGSGPGTNYSV